MVNQADAELNAEQFQPTTLIQLVNVLLPMRVLSRTGHITAQPLGGRDGKARAAQEKRGPLAAPMAEERLQNTVLPRNRQNRDAQLLALSKPAQGSLFTTKSLEFSPGSYSSFAEGLELGVQQACAGGEGRNPWGKAPGDDSPALDHPGASL